MTDTLPDSPVRGRCRADDEALGIEGSELTDDLENPSLAMNAVVLGNNCGTSKGALEQRRKTKGWRRVTVTGPASPTTAPALRLRP